jgi:hypothetical protein
MILHSAPLLPGLVHVPKMVAYPRDSLGNREPLSSHIPFPSLLVSKYRQSIVSIAVDLLYYLNTVPGTGAETIARTNKPSLEGQVQFSSKEYPQWALILSIQQAIPQNGAPLLHQRLPPRSFVANWADRCRR